jgi:hypothetical protein
LFEMILPSWSDLKKPATHGCPNSLSLSRYHPPSLLPVLPLVNMPVHSNSFEIRPNCIQTLWSFEFILIGVGGLWRRLQFTDSKLLTLVSQKTLVMCIHQRKWTAPWGCLARHGLPLVYLLPHDIDIFWCQRCNEPWQGFFLLPWFSHVAFDHPFNVPGRSFAGYGRRAGRNWNWTYKLYISILYIYIICRNKLKTTTNHKTQVPATRYFLSHTQRSTRGETTIHRLLVCNNTPRAV